MTMGPNQFQNLTIQDVLAPGGLEIDFSSIKVGNIYHRSFFASGYPRFVQPNWLEPLIAFNHAMSVAMFIYPSQLKGVLDDLKRKIAEMEATIQTDIERGKAPDPKVQTTLEDAYSMQDQLVKGAERFFQFGLYITVPSPSVQELDNTSKLVESTLRSLSTTLRPTTLQMEEGFLSTQPLSYDPLFLTHNMDTTSLATTFPFVSSELIDKEGLIYGINEHNDSLVILDRFKQENGNATIFAKSGAGKSYMIKLEILRAMMFGIEVIVIDPEREYVAISNSVGGDYINFAPNSPVKINPFDLSQLRESGEDELGRKILTLTGFLKLLMGALNPIETALLDRALNTTYRLKGITSDPKTQLNPPAGGPPLMEDLYKVLVGMEDPNAASLAARMERFIKGSLVGIFSAPSNINIKNQLTVFSVRDLPDELRPLAMYLILDFIWTKIRNEPKKRLLVVDEAWYMMKAPDSANFLVEMAKRARKYQLGLTTITQDVEDFLVQERGKEIISNSSIQILLKQAPASIELLGEVFHLSIAEKRLLLSAQVGQGLFFAGNTHVAIQVISSPEEHQLIISNPKQPLDSTSI